MGGRAPWLPTGGAAAAVVVLAVWAVPGVRSEPGVVPLVDDVVQPLGYVLAASLATWGAWSRPVARGAWGLVAAALWMRTLALLHAIFVLDRQPMQNSLAGIAWVLSVLLLLGGLVWLVRAHHPRGSRVLPLDATMGVLTVAAVTTFGFSASGLDTSVELPGRAVPADALFPLLEVGILAALAGLVAGTQAHLARSVAVLGGGVAAFAVANGVALSQVASGGLQPGTVLGPLSLASAVLIAASPWIGTGTVTAAPAQPAALGFPRALAIVCLVVLVADAVVAVPPTAIVLAVAGMVVGLARSSLTQSINARLSDEVIAEKDEELERFRSLVEASGDFIALGTMQGEVRYLNPAGRRMVGLPERGRLPELTIAEFLTPEAARHQAEVERPQILRTGSWRGESTLGHRDGGEPVPVFKNTFIVRDDGGSPWLLGTIQRDITDLRDARLGLTRFQSLVEASSDFIALAELDGTVRYLNPAGRRMVGMDHDVDVEQTTISDFLTEEGLRASVEVEQPAVLAAGEWQGESTLRDLRGGPPIPVTINSFLVRRPDTGEPWLIATVQRNITELHAARTQLQRLADERQELLRHLVEAQEAERSRIAADVHDDPVQVMAAVDLQLGLVQRQLETGQDAESTRALVEQMRGTVSEANDRLRYLLFDLDSPAQREDVETALGEAAAYVLGDTVRWDVRCEAGLDLDETTRVLVYRIAKEAMVNVRKHARATRVHVHVGRRDGGVEVVVADDGVGLPPGRLTPRPGHRGVADMRDRAAIAGGSVTLTDGPEGGARMRLWIPMPASAHAD